MIISDKKKFIYIHIFKTAGTSVSYALMPYANTRFVIAYGNWITRKIFAQIEKYVMKDGGKYFIGFHKHATAFEVMSKLGTKYENYYKFAFVRNPYDRLVSAYYYYVQSPWIRNHCLVKDDDFYGFVEGYISTVPKRQVDYVLNKSGDNMVNFVGRYEGLEKDMLYISNLLNINDLSIKKKNVSKYRKKNNIICEKSIRLINDYYHDDFVYFGYEKLDL